MHASKEGLRQFRARISSADCRHNAARVPVEIPEISHCARPAWRPGCEITAWHPARNVFGTYVRESVRGQQRRVEELLRCPTAIGLLTFRFSGRGPSFDVKSIAAENVLEFAGSTQRTLSSKPQLARS